MVQEGKLSPEGADPECNHFGIIASQPLAEWRRKGWLHPDDPRGWFQWYCRYFMGRRHEDDHRQIGRWRAFARHAGTDQEKLRAGRSVLPTEQRQALLQWAYDSRVM